MLSLAARSVKTHGFKAVRPLTAVRTKVTLPDLPYGYDVLLLIKIIHFTRVTD